jgi:HEAT repeat protein
VKLRPRLLVALAFALAACRPDPAPPAFALERVVAPTIAALETEVARDVRASASAEADLDEHVRGLVFDLPGVRGQMRELQLAEIGELGDPAVTVLAAVLADPRTDDGPRAAAVDGLAAIDSPSSVAQLAGQAESARIPWVRAYAANALARSKQDHFVPRLILRLKYETDSATVVELATTLTRFGNYSGLDGLFVLRQNSVAEVASLANERLATLAAAAGVADGDALWRAWNGSDPAVSLAIPEPSARHRLEIWKRIALLTEHDLRAVDDARFVLSRSAAWVVEPLCRALHDEDVYTRVHAAQCLQRMGPRGTTAGPSLMAALGEPRLAPAATLALGSIAYPACVGEVARRVERGFDPELRVAAAQALGPLNLPAGVEPLKKALAADEPIDLRQAAALSLLMLGHDREATKFLVECLTLPGADADAAEAALDGWLAKLVSPAAQEVHARWQALAGPPGTTPAPQAVVERQHARAALLAPALAGLVP